MFMNNKIAHHNYIMHSNAFSFNFHNSLPEIGTIIISILQMKKEKHFQWKFKTFSKSHVKSVAVLLQVSLIVIINESQNV